MHHRTPGSLTCPDLCSPTLKLCGDLRFVASQQNSSRLCFGPAAAFDDSDGIIGRDSCDTLGRIWVPPCGFYRKCSEIKSVAHIQHHRPEHFR
jgi:hypothetical protein